MLEGGRLRHEDEAALILQGPDTRQKRIEAAGAAIGLILEQVGIDAAIVLLNASISAVEDRIRARDEAKAAR